MLVIDISEEAYFLSVGHMGPFLPKVIKKACPVNTVFLFLAEVSKFSLG
jgi:hypothetical protein